jgi:hypothetical protein
VFKASGDVPAQRTAATGPGEQVCTLERQQVDIALFAYKAKYGHDAPDEQSLVPEFIPAQAPHWDYQLGPTGPIVKGVNGCA